MAGFHQAGGLQPRQRLAHHGTTDALFFHDRRLGGQLLTTLDQPVADTLRQLGHQLLGQAALLAARARLGVLIVHDVFSSRLTAWAHHSPAVVR
ncbi:hypothetical protein D3C78_1742430 [compost metagenome]